MTEAPRGYFPGSRQALPEPGQKKPAPEKVPQTWDSRPITKVVGGDKVEFFVIGALCAALGRPPVTIRAWVAAGHIPDAKFRMPDKNGIRGRRLYTRDQIEAIIRVAESHGIRQSTRVDWTQHATFADEIREAWRLLG